jgi:DNA-binding response OmpR family regulator/nitrogen-specific signal transduction histidine kinase
MLMLYLKNRQMTREKLRTQEQAKKINEAKVQFFLNISHEIRTPLSLIISPLKKLLLSDKDTERRKSYGTMQRNSERILHLINQLMDISKIEKGQLALKFQEVDIVEYVKGICSIFDDQSDAREITFTLNAEPHRIPAWIDPRQFDKAIINVLSNAFKFTPDHGVIDVSIRAGQEIAGSGSMPTYEIIIADNGIGIPDNEKHKIFECFHQVKNAHNHFVEGTGIGLNLTRSIIDLHHGQIRVENNPASTGSRFIMSMPLGKDHLRQDELDIPMLQEAQHDPISTTRSMANTADAGLKPRSKSRHHILLVDDDPEIRKYIRQELESEYHVRESANGKEGLAAALAKAPDLIISDVKMPDMDGITFCRKVKQNININHVPVVLLTAKANDEDNLEGLGIGADAYMVKPFNVEILKKTMEAIIRNREMLRNSFSGNQMQDDKVRKVEFKSADEKLLTKIVDIINANIANTDFNVEMMSAEIGISRVHLHRKMKELTNQSTRDFIRNTRLKQAAQLLSGKHQNISDVAYATGFTTLAVFSTAFKDCYGISPREYMLSHDEQHPQDIER